MCDISENTLPTAHFYLSLLGPEQLCDLGLLPCHWWCGDVFGHDNKVSNQPSSAALLADLQVSVLLASHLN